MGLNSQRKGLYKEETEDVIISPSLGRTLPLVTSIVLCGYGNRQVTGVRTARFSLKHKPESANRTCRV